MVGTEQLNVVLISVDSLRADHVGADDGSGNSLTPTIDDLAADSVSFAKAFANGPYTRISFPSILTGTYAWTRGGIESMSDKRPMLAATLQKNGYSTGGFHSNPYLKATFNYDRGFQHYDSSDGTRSTVANLRERVVNTLSENSLLYRFFRRVYSQLERSTGIEVGTPYKPGGPITDRAIEWLESAAVPAFLWIHYMDVHHPYIPHDGVVSEDISRREAIRLRQVMIEDPDSLTPEDIETLRTLYKGEIQYTDSCIGRLLDGVDSTLGLENTIIVFLSDHGESFGEHGYYGHPGELHDVLLHIPLLISIPDMSPKIVKTPVSAVDVMPTILDMLDIPIPDDCAGTSLRTITSDPPVGRTVYAHAGVRSDGKVMVTDARTKLVRSMADGSETIFRRDESGEQRVNENIDDEPVRSLQEDLDDHIDHIDSHRGDRLGEVEVADETLDRLKRLGYN